MRGLVAETRDAASDAADALDVFAGWAAKPDRFLAVGVVLAGGVMTSIPRDSDIIGAAALLTLVLLIRLVRIFGL